MPPELVKWYWLLSALMLAVLAAVLLARCGGW